MKYYDIHTHHRPIHAEDTVILNRIIGKENDPPATPNTYFSCGIHPWYIYNIEQQLDYLRQLSSSPYIVAIGEAGLDKLIETPLSIQGKVFLAQAKVAEEVGKPLIIHCVKAWPELIAARKKVAPESPWIIHGFRGNAKLAEQLIDQGFLLSFGDKFNPTALQAAWPQALLAETDDKEIDIRTVYQQLADSLSISIEVLASQLAENTEQVFCLIK